MTPASKANLVWDAANTRWTICNSGAREGGRDTNAVNDLAYVNGVFSFLLNASDILEGKQSGNERVHITEAQKNKWRGYVTNLSRFPTIMFNNQRVFKEAENRNKMCLGGPGDNSDVLSHVFPGEALGLNSDPEWLQIARNTVAALNPEDKKASWFQANCFPKIYTQAVRSGYPAEKVLANLSLLLAGRQPYDDRGDHVQLRANLTIVPPVHGLESVGAIEAINSMLLQSHDRVIRVFPVWVKNRDASFQDLRAFGAFLVSSEYHAGQVKDVTIKSEAGRLCRIANPWPGKACEVWASTGGQPEKVNFRLDGNVITFPTEKAKQYRIRTP
ncbi:MAG: glycoside hydrolase family 95-like protein [Verrucomicrobiota bacterium]